MRQQMQEMIDKAEARTKQLNADPTEREKFIEYATKRPGPAQHFFNYCELAAVGSITNGPESYLKEMHAYLDNKTDEEITALCKSLRYTAEQYVTLLEAVTIESYKRGTL